MTDLATRPGADEAPIDDDHAVRRMPQPRRRRRKRPRTPGRRPSPRRASADLALWIGIPAGVAVVGLVASSLVLIAPGTSVAGVPVGGLTPGAAADAVQKRLAETTIVLTGAGGDAEVTGADSAPPSTRRRLADRAFASTRCGTHRVVRRRRRAQPCASTRRPRPRRCARRRPTSSSTPSTPRSPSTPRRRPTSTTPAVPGAGIDVEAVRARPAGRVRRRRRRASRSTRRRAESPRRPRPPSPRRSAASLNSMLDTAGFYVGAERTVPIDRAVAASWLTVDARRATARSRSRPTRPRSSRSSTRCAPAVNRDAVNATVITDSGGEVLREESRRASPGRALGDTVERRRATSPRSSSSGNAVFTLPVTEVAPVITDRCRAAHRGRPQRSSAPYLFENEQVVSPGTSRRAGRLQLRAPAIPHLRAKLDDAEHGQLATSRRPRQLLHRERAVGHVLQRRRGPARRVLAQQLRQPDEPRLRQHARRRRRSSSTAGRRPAPRSGSTTDQRCTTDRRSESGCRDRGIRLFSSCPRLSRCDRR